LRRRRRSDSLAASHVRRTPMLDEAKENPLFQADDPAIHALLEPTKKD
jgi:hypothetical protein